MQSEILIIRIVSSIFKENKLKTREEQETTISKRLNV